MRNTISEAIVNKATCPTCSSALKSLNYLPIKKEWERICVKGHETNFLGSCDLMQELGVKVKTAN